MFGGAASTQANTSRATQARPAPAQVPAAASASDIQLTSYDSYDTSGPYDPYAAPCDLGPAVSVGRQGQCFVGAEYLSVRANPSQSISYLTRDQTDPFDATNTFENVDYGYDGSFRLYGGYRWNDCGEEIRFTYSRFDSEGDFTSPEVGSTATITYIADLEILALNPGDYLTGRTSVELDSYDVGWSKTIPLGSPMCGDCGDDCCDPCGGYCPAWDITFTGAVRAADYSASRSNQSFNVLDQVQNSANDRVDFEGIGGRVGLLGRRYLGKKGIANVYVKGDISLLLGDYESIQTQLNQASPPDIAVTHSISGTRLIPVTEIEAGASVYLTSNCSFTAGYILSAWHDLGFQAEYDFGLPVTYDDANIMGFDGCFLRLETAF
jgi:hypothetical protein